LNRTTLAHNAVLGLSDTSKAMGAIPYIPTSGERAEQAAGTAGKLNDSDPQPYPQQLGSVPGRQRAIGCDLRGESEQRDRGH